LMAWVQLSRGGCTGEVETFGHSACSRTQRHSLVRGPFRVGHLGQRARRMEVNDKTNPNFCPDVQITDGRSPRADETNPFFYPDVQVSIECLPGSTKQTQFSIRTFRRRPAAERNRRNKPNFLFRRSEIGHDPSRRRAERTTFPCNRQDRRTPSIRKTRPILRQGRVTHPLTMVTRQDFWELGCRRLDSA
jgi:hypothetical protein